MVVRKVRYPIQKLYGIGSDRTFEFPLPLPLHSFGSSFPLFVYTAIILKVNIGKFAQNVPILYSNAGSLRSRLNLNQP